MENQTANVQEPQADNLEASAEDQFLQQLEETEQIDQAPEEENLGDGTDDAGEEDPQARPSDVAEDAILKIGDDEVTVKELKDGYLRHDDYTHKTQELETFKSQVQNQAYEAVAKQNEFSSRFIMQALSEIDNLVLPGVTMDALNRLSIEDPQRALAIQAQMNVLERWKQNLYQKASGLQEQANNARAQVDVGQRQEFATELQKSQQKLSGQKWYTPEWQRQATSFAAKHDIPKEYLAGISNAGAVEIIRKAMLWEDSQSRIKAGKVQPRVSSQVPGSKPLQNATSKFQQRDAAIARASKTRGKEDSANAYAALFN